VGSSVKYTIAANRGTSQRTGTLTVGSAGITVTQAGFLCDFNQDGSTTVADVQLAMNEVLGLASPVNDLNGDGVVNVVDFQVEVNAALGLACSAN
jgi:hypothetical protein